MHRTLGDFLSDLFQNSVEAGARCVDVELKEEGGLFVMRVADDGCGMTEEQMAKARDPFYTDGIKHPGRRVGLGLPFLVQTAEMTGGRFTMESEKGRGTTVEAVFPLGHMDTPPPGDWASTLSQLLALSGDFESRIHRKRDGRSYRITRWELKEALGSLEDLEALGLLRDFFLSAEAELNEGDE